MNYTSYEDLYNTRWEDICNFFGRGLVLSSYGGSYIRAFQAIIPEFTWDENRFRKGQISRGETEWLNYLEVSSGLIMRQYKIIGSKLSLDGAQPDKMVGYLYHGDYYHGHPRYPSDSINPTCKKTFGDLYNNTKRNEEFFRISGFKLIIIWENDWNRAKNAVKKLQKVWRNRY